MSSSLIVAAGMPRAGSGWHYNLIHDLVVAGGGWDARQIRQRYLLNLILTEVNCNIGAFTAKRLIPVLVPVLLGKTYVIKSHASPSSLTSWLIQKGWIFPLYIYRDPRDALLSAYEYGCRKRESGRDGAFSNLDSIEKAIDFMFEYVKIAETWLDCRLAFHTRYENLILDYPGEAKRVADFLGLDLQQDSIKVIIQRYSPDQGRAEQIGTHFVKGKIGRYRKKLSQEQQQLCLDRFGDFINRMRYAIP
jgi:hypothetical protein